jgi:beta-glucanase (GH16 family)
MKRLLLLVTAATSMHCQVKNSGLPSLFGDASTAGTGGSAGTSVDVTSVATGGKGAGGTQGVLDPVLDAQGSDANNASAGDAGGFGGMVDSGTVVASGGAPATDGAAAQTGGALGSGGAGAATTIDTGVVLGTGGSPGPGESRDADTGPDENPDLGADRNDVPDLGPDILPDVPSAPAEAADAPPPVADATAETTIDTAPPLTLLWHDEFEGAANAGVDTSKWTYNTQTQVNNEKQQYTASRQNVFLDGSGHLVIRGLKASAQYTSGRIETNGKFSFKTGRIEVKAMLPAGIGSFPGIIMMGTSGAWPQCGEIGIMEQYGQDKSWFYASAYADGSANSGDERSIRYDFPDATTASTDFHIYSADWYGDHLVIQVDGAEVMRTSFGTSSPFYTTPEYIVLDVAIGGNMGGAIDPNAFPMDMIVDYVRVYSF